MISIVSFSESRGGAAKAAQKFFLAIKKRDFPVNYVVVEKSRKQSLASSPNQVQFFWHFIKRLLAFFLMKLQISKNVVKRSLNLFGCTHVLKEIANDELVHLNWINNETISLKKLPKINAKFVITLHDEWFYCGTEHYSMGSERPFVGYNRSNKNVLGFDWDRVVWRRKKYILDAIKGRSIFTVPSSWMLERAKRSILLEGHDIRYLPNIINTDIFKPCSMMDPIKKNISEMDRVIVFGGSNGLLDDVKGFKYLYAALDSLLSRPEGKYQDVLVVSFGPSMETKSDSIKFRQLNLGYLNQDQLAQLYSRALFTVVPSLFESFGQVAAESLACETPVLAFNTSGLRDIVLHKKNGYLADPFSVESLVEGMEWLLNRDESELSELGKNARHHIESNFSEGVVTDKLIAIYEEQGITLR